MDQAVWVQETVLKYEARLIRYVSRMVPESHAREIVQEAFLRLLQQEHEVRERAAEWLYSVCRNQAIDSLRGQGYARAAAAAGAVDVPSVSPEEHLSRSQEKIALLKHVSQLPDEQQEVLRLKVQGELSYKEISAVTGHSVSYVGVLIHEAMTTLRARYGVRK